MAPSMLCQRHAMPSIWSYSASPAFQIAWNTPAFSQSRNRLWTALALPNRSLGKAFHWQPVRSTYTTASNTCRAGLGGRPAPGFRTYSLSAGRSRTGISGSTLCQKSSVTTHESTRFLVAKVLPYTASPAAQGCSLLFTDKFLFSLWLRKSGDIYLDARRFSTACAYASSCPPWFSANPSQS